MILKKCLNGTEQNCTKWGDQDVLAVLESEEALEEVVWNGFKMWHLIFFSIMGALSLIILLCCCVKFRIPRTKQEIEADYIRRKILRKFRNRLKAIQNQELDEMDLKKALDKIRAEFKSDTESLAQSEGFSAATLSSTGGPGQGGTYRRASQIQIDISLEELRAHSLGFKARLILALSRICGRSKVSQSDKVALTVDAEGEAQLTVPEGAFSKKKPETAGTSKPKKEEKTDKDKKDKKEDKPDKKGDKPDKKEDKPDKKDDKPDKKGDKQDKIVEKKTLAPPKEEVKKKKKEKEEKTSEVQKSKEVKVQVEAPKDKPTDKPSDKDKKDKDKKEKEKKDKEAQEKAKKEEKERKKLEKEKEKAEKEKEKAKLKIENEKKKKDKPKDDKPKK